MSEEQILFSTKINTGDSETSVKSLRAQMRSLREELSGLEVGSSEFNKIAAQAGKLQDKIKDVQAAVDTFNPEQKFKAFGAVVGGVASGFSAAQGAMALFGNENKNMEAALLKTQGAMALANGLNGLLGMRDSLGLVAAQIKGSVVNAFTTLRGAIAATGIGLLVIALGAIIANWKELVKTIETAFPGFKKVEEFFTNFKSYAMGTLKAVVAGFEDVGKGLWKLITGHPLDAIEEFKKVGADMATAFNEGFDKQYKSDQLKSSIEERKNKLDLLEAQGKDVTKARLQILKDELSLLEKGSDEYNKKLIEVEKLRTDIRKTAAEKRLKYESDLTKKLNDIADRKFEKEKQRWAEEEKKTKDFEIARQNQIDEDLKFAAFQEEQSKASIELAKKEQEAKLSTYKEIGNGLQQLSSIAGDQTEAGKALGIASATIDTYVGATKAYAQGGVLGFISAAAIIVAGLANIQKIISVQVPKVAGGASSGLSVGSVTPPNIQPPSNTTRLLNGNSPILTRNLDVKNNRVYVLESDITNKQKNVKSIQNKATVK